MEIRNVPAQDATTTTKSWELSKAQWALYYWLLAHSKWNSFEQERHYYIYRNTYTNVQIMKDTGIKSPQTVAAAYKKLLAVKAIEVSPFHEGAYIIHTTPLYVPMSVSILRYLLAFNKYIDPAISITLFAILARMYRLDQKKPIDFTKAVLGKLLGLAKQNVNSADIIMILSLLEHSGLIALNKAVYTNALGVECIRYTLTKIDTEGKQLEAYINPDDEEFNETQIQQLYEALLKVQ